MPLLDSDHNLHMKELEIFWKIGNFFGIHYFDMSDHVTKRMRTDLEDSIEEYAEKKPYEFEEPFCDELRDFNYKFAKRYPTSIFWNPEILIWRKYDQLPDNIK
jgi:hypothetical protein